MSVVEAIVPAVTALIIAVIGWLRSPGRERSNILHDLAMIEKLPDSPKRRKLLSQTETRMAGLLERETSGSRDVPVAVMALFSTVLLTWLSVWLFQREVWWGYVLAIVTGFVAVTCGYGMVESLQRVPRDNGRPGRRSTREKLR